MVDETGDTCIGFHCNISEWRLQLTLGGCRRNNSIQFRELSEPVSRSTVATFRSTSRVQEPMFSYPIQESVLMLYHVAAVSNGTTVYYLLRMESNWWNISFPITAVPFNCSEEPGLTEIAI